MDFKKKALGFGSRILRIVGIIAVIYVSMVFYLALTERRNAFPRAITHKEAREAIATTAKSISCTMEDGTVLEGWSTGKQGDATFLYYPDADEDAAQFIAEVQELDGTALVALRPRRPRDFRMRKSGQRTSPSIPCGARYRRDFGRKNVRKREKTDTYRPGRQHCRRHKRKIQATLPEILGPDGRRNSPRNITKNRQQSRFARRPQNVQ